MLLKLTKSIDSKIQAHKPLCANLCQSWKMSLKKISHHLQHQKKMCKKSKRKPLTKRHVTSRCKPILSLTRNLIFRQSFKISKNLRMSKHKLNFLDKDVTSACRLNWICKTLICKLSYTIIRSQQMINRILTLKSLWKQREKYNLCS